MKKIIAFLLVLVMMLGITACAPTTTDTPSSSSSEQTPPASTVMTHAQYLAAEEAAPVEIEAYVQATQSWWDNKIVVYAQDKIGGYIAYNLSCTEEEAAKLVPGTKINIKGFKTFYKGMPEIAEGATFTVVEGADTYIAPAEIMTDLLGKKELIDKVGVLGAFNGLTIKSISYKNDAPGDDIYVDFTLGEATYSFCVERYLTDPDTEVYKAFAELKAGDVVDVQGFVYWYDADVEPGVASENAYAINTHITKVTKVG